MHVRFTLVAALLLLLVGCAPAPTTQAPATQPTSAAKAAPSGKLVIYSGRNEQLIAPLIERFKQETGIDAQVRYGDTAQLAATILEEGANSPADLFFAQDAGALGALAQRGRLAQLPEQLLATVEPRFRSPKGEWVGLSGRARTVVYNTQSLKESDLPDSILGFTDPKWKGQIGWAPTNGSFQSFVTALRVQQGDAAAKKWLEGVKANQPKSYANNTAIVEAVAKGEIQVGLVNHYYLLQQLATKGEAYPVRNYTPRSGDVGAMVNIAGAGILNTSKNRPAAERFIAYALEPAQQQYFADQTYEYPLIPGVKADSRLTPLDQIKTPPLDLGNLADLEGTLKLLRDLAILS